MIDVLPKRSLYSYQKDITALQYMTTIPEVYQSHIGTTVTAVYFSEQCSKPVLVDDYRELSYSSIQYIGVYGFMYIYIYI